MMNYKKIFIEKDLTSIDKFFIYMQEQFQYGSV